jgi:O-antigen/teichoic acid export membrane protein
LAMLALAFAMHDPTRRLGFLLAPVAVLLASLSSYLGGMFMAEQRFGPVASTNLLRSLVVPGATLVGIPLLGAKAVFLAPMLGDLFAIVSLVVRRPRVELHARFDRATWSPLIRNGFPLGLLGVLYWAYRLVGSTSVALAGSAATYGLYVFALGPVTALAGGIAGIHAVLMPSVWSELATSSPGPAWARDAARMTLVLGVIAGLATNLCQAAFLPLVLLVVPKFHASGPLLEVLAFNVFLLSVGAIPVFVLQSERFNRQVRYLCLWAGFLTLNAAANAISLSLGGGAMSVAVNDIWVQTVALVLTFWLAWAHLGDRAIWRRAVWALAGLAAWSAVLELTVHSMAWTHSGAVSLLGLAAARCSVVVAAWGVLLVVAVRPTPNGLRQAISAAVAR